jgi:AraC-like DNA-binding protein
LRTIYLRPSLTARPTASAVVEVSPLLRELILRAVTIGMLDDREPAHVAMASLIVDELRVRPTTSFDLPMPRSARLRPIAEHVLASPGTRAGHAALGRRFGLGARTLERSFAAETGLSLGRWCRQARFHHALCRLGSGASVKEAAAGAGYRSPSAFVAAFRSVFRTTPGRYFAG